MFFLGILGLPTEKDPGGLFYRYNFTIEESTPLDIEVAVDPEMLGKVFEKLVTNRHESGSYYTPRPIVSFMCREALKAYLGEKTSSPAATIEAIVDEHSIPQKGLTTQQAGEILYCMRTLKACDPACGSGAYLLGLMQELIAIRQTLQNQAIRQDSQSLYELKLKIISDNLYGVDIDEFATNVAKLRLWLSLAVEADTPTPLPNLDFKIETGDSLLGPCKQTFQHTFGMYLLEQQAKELAEKKREYLVAHGKAKDNIAYHAEFEKLKIVFPDIAPRARFAFDSDACYLVNTGYIIPVQDKYLLGVLNSDAVNDFYIDISSQVRGGYLRFIYQYVAQIPIPNVDAKEKQGIEKLVQKCLDANGENCEEYEAEINERVARLYGLKE